MHRGSVKLFYNPTVDQQLLASRSNFSCRYLSCSIICPKITHFGHQPSWWKPNIERTLTVTSYWLHCVRFDGSAVPQSANWAVGLWPLCLHHLLSLMKRWQFKSCEHRNSGLQQSVITLFISVSTFRDWSRRIGPVNVAGKFGFPTSLHLCAIVQITLGSVKFRLSLTNVYFLRAVCYYNLHHS